MIFLLTGCMTLDGFFFNGDRVDEYTLASDVIPADHLEEVSFEGVDGNTLWGAWAHQDDPAAPVLIFFHGNSGNIDSNMDRPDLYWSWGFETFMFDYRGFGKSEGDADYAGVIADAGSAIHFVEEATGLPSTDLTFVGHSLGGFSSIHNSAASPPKVLITESMFASAQNLSNQGIGLDLPTGWFFVDPFDNVAAAREVTVPLLLIHGEEDEFINISNGELLAAAANQPSLFWRVPDGGHSTIPEVDPDGYKNHILCWSLQDPSCDPTLLPVNQ